MPDENALTVISFLFAMPNSLLVIELNHDVPVWKEKSPSRIRHLVSILINQTITNTNTNTSTGHRTQDTGTRIGKGKGTCTGHRAQGTGHRAQAQAQTQAQCTDTGADTGKGTGTMKISVFCRRRHAKVFPGQ